MTAVDCSLVRRNLDRYLERKLTPELTDQVEVHLRHREACRQELIELQNLCAALGDSVLQDMVLNEPSPLAADFTARVMEWVAAERSAGVNLVWPWLRRRWSRRQYASAAYAMSVTIVLVSAGNMLFLWNETTDLLGVLSAQGQAYWYAAIAYLSGAGGYLSSVWEWLINLI